MIIFIAVFQILIKFGTEKLENVDRFVKTPESKSHSIVPLGWSSESKSHRLSL